MTKSPIICYVCFNVNETSTETKTAERFWTDTENDEFNPNLALVRILQKRGFAISIGHPKSGLDDAVSISASSDASRIFEQISNIPEVDILTKVFSLHVPTEPEVDSCDWDDETKIKVRAFHWQRREQLCKRLAKKEDLLEANKAKKRAEKLLGKLRPLEPKDVHSLVEKVVDRELASTLKSISKA